MQFYSMNPEPENILEVRNLGVSFRNEKSWSKAINDVSFSVKKGETIGIVGESGSGKSVTSLSLLKLLPDNTSRVDSGELLLNDKGNFVDLNTLNPDAMRKIRGNRIAMIFQEPMTSLNPVMKCGKQLTEAIMLHMHYSYKEAKEYTLKLFRDVLLPDPEYAFNAYPHKLSGGQKQRVMISMAIACSPEILIADEPTTALDVTVQKSILKLLKDLQQKLNLSLLFISHDLGVISEIADKVIVMQKGSIVEQGLVADIFKKPVMPYTQGLMACRPSMRVRLKRLPTVQDYVGGVDIKALSFESPDERIARLDKIYSEPPLLDINRLTVQYPLSKPWFSGKREWFKAVDSVSFKVYPGETLGLVGESGCGKTTLGRAILRLIETSDGKITFNGEDITSSGTQRLREMRKRMQIIFQDPYSSLNPRMTIGQSIMEPLVAHKIHRNYRERKDKVIELLEKVNLESDHYNRYPHQFSGGQRQRVCIARALVLNPSFVICDESVSALDVSVQAQVLNLLNDLKKEYGFTYIFISHDLSVVKFMSDRMLVMQRGKIVEEGDSDSIYKQPKTDYTRQLIDAIPGKGVNPLIEPRPQRF